MPAGRRSYTTGHFLLNLGASPCGFVQSVQGGDATAEVVREALGTAHYAKKHLAGVKYEDVSFRFGTTLSKMLYDWIAASWQGAAAPQDGSIVTADYNFKAKSEREFFRALITETTIPALDGAAKDPAYMTLKFSPEYTRFKKSSGTVKGGGGTGHQKKWLPSNFRLQIDGLDCTKVNHIDSFTVKQVLTSDTIGEHRDYTRAVASVEFPNLRVTLPESGAQTWMDWHTDFVINGNNDESHEKNGTLVFLAPDRKQELACIRLFNLGIFRLAADTANEGNEQIKRVAAEMYVERMEFAIP